MKLIENKIEVTVVPVLQQESMCKFYVLYFFNYRARCGYQVQLGGNYNLMLQLAPISVVGSFTQRR